MNRNGRFLVTLVVVVVALFGIDSTGRCQVAKPFDQHRLAYSNLTAFRYNPLGLADMLKVGYQFRLYKDPAPLWRDAHLGISFESLLTPVMYQVGGAITVAPLSIITLSAGYRFVHWLGNLNSIQSFDSVESDYSDSALDDNGAAGGNYSAKGAAAYLGAQLIAKVGPVIASNDLYFNYSDLELKNGDPLYYSPTQDILSVQKGWFLTNDSDLLYLFDFGLLVGVRNSVVGAFYEDQHYASGSGDQFVATDRLGPILIYILHNRPGALFDRPSFILMINWWLKHRYRTGEDTSQAIPCLILGFKFNGQLWGR